MAALPAADQSAERCRAYRQPERQLRPQHVCDVADGGRPVAVLAAGRPRRGADLRGAGDARDPGHAGRTRRARGRGRGGDGDAAVHRMTARARGRAVLLAVALVASQFGLATAARADVSAVGCSARAVVVVETGPGPVAICFDGSISGLEALQLAGANPATYGFSGQGAAVCQLFGVGNPADSSCLIGPGGQYWAYYR